MRGWIVVFLLAGCGSAGSSHATITFDPCEPLVIGAANATDEQLASIDDAIAMWRSLGVAGLARGETPELAIEFRDAGSALYGLYDDTVPAVYINLRVTDPAERAITVAHELGHALGLVHISPAARVSVMNPGNLTVAPNAGDAAALATTWGGCPAP